jgi:sugar lactone lactonase YvrE
LDGPTAVAVDAQDDLYIADQGNNRIRKVSGGIITTLAGNGTAGTSGDGFAATSAELYYPSGLATDSAGNVYISEYSNDVRKVTTDGKIHLEAGIENAMGYSGDGEAATSAELSYPTGMALDAAGNLYIVDEDNTVIREVDTSGIIHTIAGNYSGGASYSGDGGDPTGALLNYPQGLAVSSKGTLFIADAGNQVIRAVSYAARSFSFSALNVGAESSAETATVENLGNAVLDFTGLSVSDNFVQTASGGTDCSASTNLAADASCEISIAAEPTQSGSLSGNVTVTNGAFNIALSGTGNAVSFNPTSLSFGNQAVQHDRHGKDRHACELGQPDVNYHQHQHYGSQLRRFQRNEQLREQLGCERQLYDIGDLYTISHRVTKRIAVCFGQCQRVSPGGYAERHRDRYSADRFLADFLELWKSTS